MRPTPLLLGGAAALLIAAGAGLLAWQARPGGGGDAPSARIGGPFQLETADGRGVTEASFRGKLMVVYFGYTHCPDACPLALNNIAGALALLGPERDHVAPLFVTVDPARDTPPVISRYTHLFDAQITGLTGSDGQVARVEAEYHVYAARHPEPHGGYSMDHSNIIYLMDDRGRFAGFIDGNATPRRIADRIEQEAKAAS